MRVLPTILAAVSMFLPTLGRTMPVLDVERMSCGGVQSTVISETVLLACTGDYALTGGTLSADSKIRLSAGGALTLNELTIAAPEIEITAGGALIIGNDISIVTAFLLAATSGAIAILPGARLSSDNGNTFWSLDPGTIRLTPGGALLTRGGPITLAPSPVPEPGAFAVFMTGLLALGGVMIGARQPHRT